MCGGNDDEEESPLDLPYYHPDYRVKFLYCPRDFFSPTQIEDYKESFRLFDKDGDGKLCLGRMGIFEYEAVGEPRKCDELVRH